MSALTPLALWMLIRGIRDGRLWAFGVFALTTGLAVLSPHPQLLQYELLLSGRVRSLPRLLRGRWRSGSAAQHGVRAPRTLGGGGRDRDAHRSGAVSARDGVRAMVAACGREGIRLCDTYSFPIEELINTYVPQFSGILDAYSGRNGIHLHSEYLGVAVLILAVLGFGAVRATRRRAFARFWLGTMIVALLWALGNSTPFFHLDLRDRSRHEVLSRAEHDHLRRRTRDRGVRGARAGARARARVFAALSRSGGRWGRG